MDLSFLLLESQKIALEKQVRFNPCSYGSLVLTQALRDDKTGRNNAVSILVLMDLSFLQKIIIEKATGQEEFQSLFLWIFRSYGRKKDEKRSSDR